jgi:ankyrin repeat protein
MLSQEPDKLKKIKQTLKNKNMTTRMAHLIYHNDIDGILEELKNPDFDINFQMKPEYCPAISYAGSKGFLPIVKLLFENGAKLNLINWEGHDTIGASKKHGRTEVVEYLEFELYKIEKYWDNLILQNTIN